MQTQRIVYDDKIVRQFVAASVLWGIVGMLVGVLIALQLSMWQLNLPPFLTFGRIRPLHTNAVIFAFVGNMMFAGIYYSTQRLTKARMASDVLSKIHFWGWQAIIVSAALTLPLGITTGKEYAELEWPIDIAITLIWVVFAVNFFWTLKNRNEKHLYVALWFYIATIMTVAVLHVVNSLAIPVGPLKSYSIFAGVQDALVQWWYGHNAVAFFLTTPILGIMYYFVPKAADRPVYSYRLSIIHFWALVFLYIWAGPHHLLFTALPDWAQSLGMIFSLMLWAPSWGGMVNGLLTLRGAWDQLRVDPVLKFFAAGVTFYGMATFEGPLLAIKSVNGLAHYTDWIIGHVHSGALGWNGLMAAGMFYWLVPRLYGTKLHSRNAANAHFYLGTVGILLYVVAMWVSGIRQGLMLGELNTAGGLKYSFLETVDPIQQLMYWMRAAGGTFYLTGMVMMAWNLVATARSGKAVDGEVEVAVETPTEPLVPWRKVLLGTPVILSVVVMALVGTLAVLEGVASTFMIVVAFAVALAGILAVQLAREKGKPTWHRLLEGRPLLFTTLAVLAVLVGGVAEIVPSVVMGVQERSTTTNVPYTALQLEGRDVYLQEGCYTCHSQMVRPFAAEVARFGEPSRADESVFDHPFQWGSRRTGPDLARVGTRYDNRWHYMHLVNPRDISDGSIMPPYEHLTQARVDWSRTSAKLSAMRAVGVPYTDQQIETAARDAERDARVIVADLLETGRIRAEPSSKMVALIGYLQRLGKPPDASPAAAAGGVATASAAPNGGAR